jgi:hypothetical protein
MPEILRPDAKALLWMAMGVFLVPRVLTMFHRTTAKGA